MNLALDFAASHYKLCIARSLSGVVLLALLGRFLPRLGPHRQTCGLFLSASCSSNAVPHSAAAGKLRNPLVQVLNMPAMLRQRADRTSPRPASGSIVASFM
jgi:hypothetical protein